MKPVVYLVCGFRRTGKDYLVQILRGHKPFNWTVYRDSNNPSWRINKRKEVVRISFADKLREEVNQILKIKTVEDYDSVKDQPIFDGRTYRDYLIEHALYRRNQDIDYWVKKAANWDRLNPDKNYIITDWRYPNEIEYLQTRSIDLVTIRLYRSSIPIPPSDIPSEHSLDYQKTDYLFVLEELGSEDSETDDDGFGKACSVFPQYRDYVS